MAKAAKLGDAKHPLRMKINKRFFVDMLTRDIELEDAVLDLLDNCLDGIVRSTTKSLETKTPFKGYWSKITLNANTFEITDNCGGIPKDLIERAFGIGRNVDPNEHYKTIGIYGIGMKRAIFKMALEASVQSHSDFGFEVRIDEKWLRDEDVWRLDYRRTRTPFQKGTRVYVSRLRPEISRVFSTDAFKARLHTFIARHYAIILNKGFRVQLNGTAIEAAPVSILSSNYEKISKDTPSLAPYMLSYDTTNVKAKLWVGMYRTPAESEGEEESETEQRQSSDNSGWTIICNDRAIVSNDTTILTGWGEAGVPRFHPQFIGIRGVLTLDSDYPLQLPLTTTKRGLDASSELYLNLKEYMREGTKIFTSFTNHWKADRIKARKLFSDAELLELHELRALMSKCALGAVRKLHGALRFEPSLPTPAPSEMRRISFLRHQNDISLIAAKFLEEPKAKPADVGAACFDEVFKKVSR
jgi:Histidine kinase-, DNA gyrase B-, and HSP90-like ATPase